jgi:[ribosomal protein S18]-alanine N-acetyltransferase
VDFRPVVGDAEARACATIMATTDPWLTLGRGFDECLAAMRDPSYEAYVATIGGQILGFVLLTLHGTFSGYIKSVAVVADWRSKGLGTKLLAFAEERIFRERPNVFVCASSFNPRARALYERLGYEAVGVIRDFIVRGHDEVLFRKTIGPLTAFSPR